MADHRYRAHNKKIHIVNRTLFKYKNIRGKSKTIVGEIPTIDLCFFLFFCLVKWVFETDEDFNWDAKGVRLKTYRSAP